VCVCVVRSGGTHGLCVVSGGGGDGGQRVLGGGVSGGGGHCGGGGAVRLRAASAVMESNDKGGVTQP
jgi:hypothetical protein